MAELTVFTVLTFAATWAAWLVSAHLAAVPGFGLGGPVFLLGVFAPAIIAISQTARRGGRAAVGRLLAKIGRWNVDGRLYVFAIFYMVGMKLIAAAVQRFATGTWPRFGDTPLPLMFGAIVVSMWVQAGEEIGWRGFALPKLAKRIGLAWASLVIGIVWALWHLPLFFLAGSGSTGQSFPLYLLHVTALSVAMAWLYWRSAGSLLLVMLMHASVNNTTNVVPAALPNAADPFALRGSFVAWATVAVSWALAAVLLHQMRHEHKSEQSLGASR
jgi:membrane protease YdiL (CAAX protease family)